MTLLPITVRDAEVARPVLTGDTADVYLHRALSVLRSEGVNPEVMMEFAAGSEGVLCGMNEVKALLLRVLPEASREAWALEDGTRVANREVVLRVRAQYASFGLYETAISGLLASYSGWATAADRCVQAAGTTPVVCFAARFVHPSVAGQVDYAAVAGGKCAAGSTILGSRLTGRTPSGTIPASLVLVMGDAVRATMSFDRQMPPEVPRVALVDVLRDEAEEAVEVAKTLRDRLRGVRIETPEDRGGVTPSLVKEVRARLNLAGYGHVDIYVSGDLTPEKIREFIDAKAPVAGFAVGRYIAAAGPLPILADIKEVGGRPIARRGRIPGAVENKRLIRVI